MRSICLSVVMAGACANPVELTEVEQSLVMCPASICGTNSPEIAQMGFHELESTGTLENSTGFRLTGFWQNGRRHRLVVQNAQLFGVARKSGTLSGQALVGAEIHVEWRGTRTFAIRITEVGTLPIPIASNDPTQPTMVETYELDYGEMFGAQSPSEWKNLCGGVPLDNLGDPEYGHRETAGQDPKHSILFEGDRIDLERKTIDPKGDPAWFNFGCSAHTLAKLFLTRNALVSLGHDGDHPGRQATLKLLTGDYCGDGEPFTVAGQALVWMGGQMAYQTTPAELEARWDEHGAVCLDTPRMAHPTTDAGKKLFPDIEDALATRCARRPRRCADPEPRNFDGALRVSALYEPNRQ